MQRIRHFAAFFTFLWPVYCPAQGILTITFDGPPLQPTNSATLVQFYSEAGMDFMPLPGSDGFGRNNNAGSAPAYPVDGSTYLQAGYGEGLEFDFADGSLFGLASVDLAAYGINQPDYTVDFVGYLSNGGTISTSFSGTGINFQTFDFGPEWSSGLTEVQIPNSPWSLDNLVVIVPEPSGADLYVLSAVIVLLWRNRRE